MLYLVITSPLHAYGEDPPAEYVYIKIMIWEYQ